MILLCFATKRNPGAMPGKIVGKTTGELLLKVYVLFLFCVKLFLVMFPKLTVKPPVIVHLESP